MSTFNWKTRTPEFTVDSAMRRLPVIKTPGPASQITFSKNVPNSINTEAVKGADKAHALRKGTLNPRGDA